MATMSEKEKQDWNNLYEYVKEKIMNYDITQKLSKRMILRLRGLQKGKFLDNNNIDDSSYYSFEIILLTYKYCYFDISKILRTKVFKNEEHKFNYIASIVESKLNDVYMKINKAKKKEEEIEKSNLENIVNTTATYTRKTKDDNNARYKDFW